MSITAILALLRDAAIVGALSFIIWKIYNAGAESVKQADLQAVQKQLIQQAAQQAQYAQEATNAQTQHSKDLQTITAIVASHSAPIVVRIPPNPNAVPILSPAAGGQSTPGGPIDPGSGTSDIRPGISVFETRYEQALADCRAAIASWPR